MKFVRAPGGRPEHAFAVAREGGGAPLPATRVVRERSRGRQHRPRGGDTGDFGVGVVSSALVHVVRVHRLRAGHHQQSPTVRAEFHSFDERGVRHFTRLHDVQRGGLDDGDDAANVSDEDVRAGFRVEGVRRRAGGGGVQARARYAAHEGRDVYAAGHLRERRALASASEGERHGSVVGGAHEREGGIVGVELRAMERGVEGVAEDVVRLGDVPDGEGAVGGG